MTAPNPNQPRAGVSSTPSSAAGTRANVAFNDLIRKTEAPAPVPPATPDEVVFEAFRNAGWTCAGLSDSAVGSLALTAVRALRNAGYDL